MNTDIRISTSFRNHRKIKKLKRTLGGDGVLALVNLWIGAAVSKPHGVLSGWDRDDICLEADWSGDADEFVDTLIQLHLLEADTAGNFYLHNWEKHQAWVCGAEERSEKARKAAEARWKKQGGCPEHTASLKQGMQNGAYSNAPILSSPYLPDNTIQERKKFRKAENGQDWVNTETGEVVTELTPFDEEVADV